MRVSLRGYGNFKVFHGGITNDVNFTCFAGLLDFGQGYQKFSVRGPAGYLTLFVNFKHCNVRLGSHDDTWCTEHNGTFVTVSQIFME